MFLCAIEAFFVFQVWGRGFELLVGPLRADLLHFPDSEA